jgi:HEPN domain-containing protein
MKQNTLTQADRDRWHKHWNEESIDALSVAKSLYESKKYNYALFFCHLACEKCLKS